MAKTAINTIKDWFKTGKYPTQSQFWNWMDSFWHKDEAIPIGNIETLTTILDGKANADTLANKADLGEDGKVLLAQLPTMGGGGGSVQRFAKHPSLTSAHVGLLAMQQVTPLVQNPQSAADFDVEAVLANTVPAVSGNKGQAEIRVENLMLPDLHTSLLKIVFNANPNTGDSLTIMLDDSNSEPRPFTFNFGAANNMPIGATILDTFNALVNEINTELSPFFTITNQGMENGFPFFEIDITGFGLSNFEKYGTHHTVHSSFLNVTTQVTYLRDYDDYVYQWYALAAVMIDNNQDLLAASTWDTNGQETILMWRDLFSSNSQPFGTATDFGIRKFTSQQEAYDAVKYALEHNPGFNAMFNVITPGAAPTGNNIALKIETKTSPMPHGSSMNFNFYPNGSPVYAQAYIINGGSLIQPEHVPYTILGVIAGVEGNDVLIDTSSIVELQLASAAEGETGIVPFYDAALSGFYYPAVVAWRNGKVISIHGYAISNNISYEALIEYLIPTMQTNSLFRALSAANPEEKIKVSQKNILNF